MLYEEFKELIIDKIRERIGNDNTVRTDIFTKNNGRLREGIIIRVQRYRRTVNVVNHKKSSVVIEI